MSRESPGAISVTHRADVPILGTCLITLTITPAPHSAAPSFPSCGEFLRGWREGQIPGLGRACAFVDLYKAYRRWCASLGQPTVDSETALARAARELGLARVLKFRLNGRQQQVYYWPEDVPRSGAPLSTWLVAQALLSRGGGRKRVTPRARGRAAR